MVDGSTHYPLQIWLRPVNAGFVVGLGSVCVSVVLWFGSLAQAAFVMVRAQQIDTIKRRGRKLDGFRLFNARQRRETILLSRFKHG